ncbi:DNA-directed RNA polymerase II subunit 1-like [Camellia sinensis]|uniref:DNA-directed RNA polymerase II subunit 1-like n=1 Tax=Camellia sinensis TaxID=4442 RepID=UPI001035C11E|nr:DNA-directed RNA polymerase II subunit 1-like [Camellia sinensis]
MMCYWIFCFVCSHLFSLYSWCSFSACYLIPMQQGHTNEIDTQGQDTDEPVKKSRGGCGAQQPTLTIEGMKMIAEYKLQKKKNDDPEQLPEPVERKQQLSAERVASMKKCF